MSDRPISGNKVGTAGYFKKMLDKSIAAQSSTHINSSNVTTVEVVQELDQQGKIRKFLPVETFDPLMGIEDPYEVIETYRDQKTRQTIGLTKWNYPNGEVKLREVIVDSFNPKDEMYSCRWLHNPSL